MKKEQVKALEDFTRELMNRVPATYPPPDTSQWGYDEWYRFYERQYNNANNTSRVMWENYKNEHAKVRECKEKLRVVTHENNMLRKNNERLKSMLVVQDIDRETLDGAIEYIRTEALTSKYLSESFKKMLSVVVAHNEKRERPETLLKIIKEQRDVRVQKLPLSVIKWIFEHQGFFTYALNGDISVYGMPVRYKGQPCTIVEASLEKTPYFIDIMPTYTPGDIGTGEGKKIRINFKQDDPTLIIKIDE